MSCEAIEYLGTWFYPDLPHNQSPFAKTQSGSGPAPVQLILAKQFHCGKRSHIPRTSNTIHFAPPGRDNPQTARKWVIVILDDKHLHISCDESTSLSIHRPQKRAKMSETPRKTPRKTRTTSVIHFHLLANSSHLRGLKPKSMKVFLKSLK